MRVGASQKQAGRWHPPAWTPEDERMFPSKKQRLEDLSWTEFELLVGELYRRRGYTVEIDLGLGPDGGVDLILHRAIDRVYVQCKHWQKYRVGVKEIRELYGVMMGEGVAEGHLVTSSTFSTEARQFAAGKSICLVDHSEVESLVTEVQRTGENILQTSGWIADFATNSRLKLPDCPKCGSPMTLRRGRRSGAQFWGCPCYPAGCRGKRDVRPELLTFSRNISVLAEHPC